MDEERLLGRRIPRSDVAEQSVIGSMLIDPGCIGDVLEKLRPDEFYNKINRDIFETMQGMFSYAQVIDPVTVIDRMKSRGVYDEKCESYMAEVVRITPTSANVLEYAAIVKDKALMRRLTETADEINNMVGTGEGSADIMLEAAERKIYALRQDRTVGGLIPIATVMQNVFNDLSEMAASGDSIPGLTTSLPDLDRQILGLNKSELILVAARPGMGKTSIALNIALHVGLVLKKTVAIFSLEMSREQMANRLLSRASLVPNQNLLTGKLTDKQWGDIMDAARSLSATDIRINDNPSITVAEISAQCRRIPNLSLVVIDYLQLMQSAGSGHSWSNESRTQAVSDISRMLKVTAKELNVPVLCLSQLSRANEARQDKRPMLSDLRESGAIEQDADVVIGLYREGYYNPEVENPNLAEAIVLKNRKGACGTVELSWLPEYTTFGSVEKRHDED